MTATTKTTYSVLSYNMKFDTCGGHDVYQIDGMSDPIIYGNQLATEAEARALFNELVAEQQPRDRFITETKCGGNPEGYTLVLEANTFEDVEGNGDFDEFVEGETLDYVEYTADDYNGEH